MLHISLAFENMLPSLVFSDIGVGLVGAVLLKGIVYVKGKNAKKFRQGVEYGSARWGTAKDIAPFMDSVFENNIILTQTERPGSYTHLVKGQRLPRDAGYRISGHSSFH